MHNISILQELFNKRDFRFAEFSGKLTPDTKKEIIGVRVPDVKKIVATVLDNEDAVYAFLAEQHTYFEECMAHGFLISRLKIPNIERIELVKSFLPQIDNWAVCDAFCAELSKAIKSDGELYLDFIRTTLKNDEPYTARVGIVLLLDAYLDKRFDESVLPLVKGVKSDNYYVNMALAWLYSVALIKQYESTVPIIESKTLPVFVHNKSIQKARESFRICDEKKRYLNSLKIKQ